VEDKGSERNARALVGRIKRYRRRFMYIDGLDNTLESYFEENAAKYVQELIARRIKESGYGLQVALSNKEFVEEIRNTLGSSLHKFHRYVDNRIENWIREWNEEGENYQPIIDGI
jgi:hypothetical protein